MGILIRGGRIVDAATDTDMIGDIYLDDGMIQEIGSLTAWVHRMPLKALLGFIFFVNF